MRNPDVMLRARLDVTVWTVETAPYRALDIRDAVRPYWIVSHIRAGQVITETRGARIDARPGDVMVHPPHLPFSECAAGPGVHEWMGFEASLPGEGAPLDLFNRFPLSPVVPLGARRERFSAIFRPLEQTWRDARPAANDLAAAGFAALLLSEVIAAWDEAGAPARPEGFRQPTERFAGLIAYMEAHLAERLTRDDLARRVCLHPGSLDRAFRAAHGTPPLRLLQEMRLTRARRLLETTDDTLDAVARACGLGDATRLSRQFRARFGTAPGAYRAALRLRDAPLYPRTPPGA